MASSAAPRVKQPLDDAMKYFAYGSNMSLSRLLARAPDAKPLGRYALPEHDLRFHKAGKDGSGKCDAYYTGDEQHTVIGVLYEISRSDKLILDQYEGLGVGYSDKQVVVFSRHSEPQIAVMYYATAIDTCLQPFTWYKEHVLIGAREIALPADYIATIEAIKAIRDPQQDREILQLMVHQQS